MEPIRIGFLLWCVFAGFIIFSIGWFLGFRRGKNETDIPPPVRIGVESESERS